MRIQRRRKKEPATLTRMLPLDPTQVRVSQHFMLSDFMGCDSVYRHGICNRVYRADSFKIQEGFRLGAFLDDIVERYGHISISYGYISEVVSKMIVGYQDPNKPSFHRWDLGAACDIRIHHFDHASHPPIAVASELAKLFDIQDFARMITYSESPWICLATSSQHTQSDRRIHEYRYCGNKGEAPRYVKWQRKEDQLEMLVSDRDGLHSVLGDWVGRGYPSYHGGGKEQYHHVKLSTRVVLSDLLYCRDFVHAGRKNRPPEDLRQFHRAAEYLELLFDQAPFGVSITGAYESSEAKGAKPERSYETGFHLEMIPSEGVDHEEFLEVLKSISPAVEVTHDNSRYIKYTVKG